MDYIFKEILKDKNINKAYKSLFETPKTKQNKKGDF